LTGAPHTPPDGPRALTDASRALTDASRALTDTSRALTDTSRALTRLPQTSPCTSPAPTQSPAVPKDHACALPSAESESAQSCSDFELPAANRQQPCSI
jgi:hypothetical protein